MLRATRSGRLYTAPKDDDGEPLFPDHRGFKQELRYAAGEEFDIREKAPLDFRGMSPQAAGKLRKKVERVLAARCSDLELIEDDEQDETDSDTEE